MHDLDGAPSRLSPIAFMLLALFLAAPSYAQDRLQTMPGYARYEEMTRAMSNAVVLPALNVVWTNGGSAFDFTRDKQRYRYEIAERTATLLPTNQPAGRREASGRGRSQRGRERPERGRQYTNAFSPDGLLRAFYGQQNLWLSDSNGSNKIAITTEGNEKSRIKYGSASWVYGEELYQDTAIWWSTNAKKVAFYRFDESRVPDYYLALKQRNIQNTLYVEPYAKAGGTNPVVDILVYDLETKETVKLDVRSGKEFTDDVVGHYLYGVSWTSDSAELLFHRTNRRQNVMELCAANPATGTVRVIVREEWTPSWTENSPTFRFLKDGKRFIWSSERTGWNNLYLYELSGKLIAPLTQHECEVEDIIRIDEDRKLLYYTARDGDNHMKLQLHRVGLNGVGESRITDRRFHHTISFAPDGRHFIDTIETHDTPPAVRLMTADGEIVDELARTDMGRFKALGLKPVELIQFKAADGMTDLYGMLHRPSNFSSSKKYPLLVSVYAGPATTGARETFTLPNILTEFGFLLATLDSRSASGRGKRFLDAIYMKLGRPEIDDQAAGVRFLRQRRYVDGSRVGIYGTSYGGTASALCLLRHPDVFQAACASSGVTDWKNYDTIYTERYMWIPRENEEGYRAGRVMSYSTNLTGRLMIFYGTADDNVHPSNSLQLIESLQRAGKSFEIQIGPDQGHASINRNRMMEFFIENLVIQHK
jgi:dipeptidyl-peptidase 4